MTLSSYCAWSWLETMLRHEPEVHKRDPRDGEVNAGGTGLSWPCSPGAEGLGSTNEAFARRESSTELAASPASRPARLLVTMAPKHGASASHDLSLSRPRVRALGVSSWGNGMTRRRFMALLGISAVNWPVKARAQQPGGMRTVGVLIGLAENDPLVSPRVATLRQGLAELGWIEGRNLRVHYIWGAESEQLRQLARELIARQPDVIVAGNSAVVNALLQETRTVPIVFVTASDPVGAGFVASLAAPSGNATGFTNNLSSLGGKWLELLKEIAPATMNVGVMFSPETAPTGGAYFLPPLNAAASSLGIQLHVFPVRVAADIEDGFAQFAGLQGGGLVVMPDVFAAVHRLIISLAAQHRLPAMYPFRYFATEGGLMSYGADLLELYRRTPPYLDRILKGARPGELPVLAPNKIELILNLRVSKALGLSIPRITLARADEVIE
jgi:putative ABC transport system substrate-binding protein